MQHFLDVKFTMNLKNKQTNKKKTERWHDLERSSSEEFHAQTKHLSQQFSCLHSKMKLLVQVLFNFWHFALMTYSKLFPGPEIPESHFSCFSLKG